MQSIRDIYIAHLDKCIPECGFMQPTQKTAACNVAPHHLYDRLMRSGLRGGLELDGLELGLGRFGLMLL